MFLKIQGWDFMSDPELYNICKGYRVSCLTCDHSHREGCHFSGSNNYKARNYCRFWEPDNGGHPSTPHPCQARTYDAGLCWPGACSDCPARIK